MKLYKFSDTLESNIKTDNKWKKLYSYSEILENYTGKFPV